MDMAAPVARSTIVVGVDHSLAFDEAMALACEVAQGGGPRAEIHVVRALLGASHCLDMSSEEERLRRFCATYAARFRVPVTPHLSLESPEAAIVEVARADGCVLIVVGERRRGWLERLMTDSLADRIMKEAPCPVVVTRSRAEPRAPSSEAHLSLSP
jgi:nucleotide-binding universal stress UspA family protein